MRDFATALGLKPFRLISELNQAGGFASMNSNIDEGVAVKVAEKHGFILEIKHRGEVGAQQQVPFAFATGMLSSSCTLGSSLERESRATARARSGARVGEETGKRRS